MLSSCGPGRLWSDWADAQADLSLRWAHSLIVGFVMRRLINSFRYLSIFVNSCIIRTALQHDKTNSMACAYSEDSEQPEHRPSLIRAFAGRMKKHWALSYTYWAHSEASDQTGWSESSLGAHVILLVLSWGCSDNTNVKREPGTKPTMTATRN